MKVLRLAGLALIPIDIALAAMNLYDGKYVLGVLLVICAAILWYQAATITKDW